MYQKVLVPLDLSELAECALNHIKKLAKDGALGEAILLNVVEVDPAWDEMVTGFDIEAFRNTIKGKAQDYLTNVQARLQAEGIKARTDVIEANRPAQAIADYALNNGADVIVIASHGYTGLKKLMFGSVALSLLHVSHVPVLLIRPESCKVDAGE